MLCIEDTGRQDITRQVTLKTNSSLKMNISPSEQYYTHDYFSIFNR